MTNPNVTFIFLYHYGIGHKPTFFTPKWEKSDKLFFLQRDKGQKVNLTFF